MAAGQKRKKEKELFQNTMKKICMYSYRSAVLHHWVLHLVSLSDATGEEAALANVIVEMFQTPIPGERRKVAIEKRANRKAALFLQKDSSSNYFIRISVTHMWTWSSVHHS